nr:electron transport complex subunit RsxC [Shewanella sp. NIFS-20-20]
MTILDQLDQGFVWPIHGGIHPPQMKEIAPATTLQSLPICQQYCVPVPQVGELATLTVSPGQTVLKGQRLTQGQGQYYLPVHAPTSGVIAAIEPRPSNHPSGLPVLTCVIDADGLDNCITFDSANLDDLSNDEILEKIQQAGIAGMGGAAFPSHIKLASASRIELVIINGIECEPYITADDALMRHYSADIIQGIAIIEQLLKPQRIIIAIEDNKPEAIAAMQQALAASALPSPLARVTVVPTLYPSGGEKQLVQLLTGKEIPSGAIPAQLGMLIHNVGTCYAINQAVRHGKPLIERIVTVTGQQASQPGNYWLPIGMTVADVLNSLKFTANEQQMVIIGGPMMGYTLPLTEVPILKGSNCILLPTAAEVYQPTEQACIRCSECAHACPAQLLPQQLFWHSKSKEYDKASSFNLRDCIECGCCSYVCPSDIPLVEYFRVAKAALRKEADEKYQAERAKQRFEARDKRLAAEKEAREQKAKVATAKRQQSMTSSDKDAIAEAMARIKAKQATTAPLDSEQPASAETDKVSAAVARAKAKKAAMAATASSVTPTDDQGSSAQELATPLDDKAAKVAAAIARAKAKKAAQVTTETAPATTEGDPTVVAGNTATSEPEPQSVPINDKAAQIAAAIARAKAKKAAAASQTVPIEAEASASTPSAPAADDKAARIAAAVAKAKAKKAATGTNSSIDAEAVTPPTPPAPAADDKAARIAAAVAKAKAKKAATATGTNSSIDTEAATPPTPPAPTADDKAARIAAAVAKAKAKAAARKQPSHDDKKD